MSFEGTRNSCFRCQSCIVTLNLVTQSHRGSGNTQFNLASRWRANFHVDKSDVKLTLYFWAGQAGLKVGSF